MEPSASSGSASITVTSTGSLAAVSAVSAGASSGSPALGKVTTVRVCGPPACKARSCCAATASSAWIASAVASSTRPASVRVTPRVLRCTSTAPAPRSRAAICWDTADGVWCSTAAAPAKLPARATSRSTARRCASINSSPNGVTRIMPLPLMACRPEAGLMTHLNRQERTGAGLAAGSVLLVGGSVAASSLLGGYPVLGGQALRYLVAALLLVAWARLRRQPLPRPAGREWAWLAGLAVIGLAGCSVLLIEATRVADPASVGVVIGAAPLVIVIAAAAAARTRPTRRVLLAAAVVTAGSAAAQLGGATGPAWSATGLLLSAGALAGALLLAAAAAASSTGGPPILHAPTAAQLAALSYLTVAVTAVVFLTWYAAIKRLGVDRAGLFNGLIPIASLAAVALAGTGTITPLQCLAALTVLAGVILGLGPTPQAPASTVNQAAQPTQPRAETTPISPQSQPAPP